MSYISRNYDRGVIGENSGIPIFSRQKNFMAVNAYRSQLITQLYSRNNLQPEIQLVAASFVFCAVPSAPP